DTDPRRNQAEPALPARRCVDNRISARGVPCQASAPGGQRPCGRQHEDLDVATRKKATIKPAKGKAAAERAASRNTDSGPAKAPTQATDDAAALRAAVTDRAAAALAFNANKAEEYSDDSRVAASEGNHVEMATLATGSTLAEANDAGKAGTPPAPGENPAVGPMTRVRVNSDGQRLTTNHGVPLADNQNSLKAGLRGPALLKDFILREKITHFDHERI